MMAEIISLFTCQYILLSFIKFKISTFSCWPYSTDIIIQVEFLKGGMTVNLLRKRVIMLPQKFLMLRNLIKVADEMVSGLKAADIRRRCLS